MFLPGAHIEGTGNEPEVLRQEKQRNSVREQVIDEPVFRLVSEVRLESVRRESTIYENPPGRAECGQEGW